MVQQILFGWARCSVVCALIAGLLQRPQQRHTRMSSTDDGSPSLIVFLQFPSVMLRLILILMANYPAGASGRADVSEPMPMRSLSLAGSPPSQSSCRTRSADMVSPHFLPPSPNMALGDERHFVGTHLPTLSPCQSANACLGDAAAQRVIHATHLVPMLGIIPTGFSSRSFQSGSHWLPITRVLS